MEKSNEPHSDIKTYYAETAASPSSAFKSSILWASCKGESERALVATHLYILIMLSHLILELPHAVADPDDSSTRQSRRGARMIEDSRSPA